MFNDISKERPVIAWWSGGVTSAVTCKLCIEWFGVDNVRVIWINTRNEDPELHVFKHDCELWYNKVIEDIYSLEYQSIQDVWEDNLSLNVATGAICSTVLKREVRQAWQEKNKFAHQAFGFDIDEIDRAKAMKLNYPDCKPIFPLIYSLLNKKNCIKEIQDYGIELPESYKLGFHNNNCWQTGCVQGGIGYWQKMGVDFPDKFYAMAKMEHKLTDMKGQPVTMLKDQSKGGGLVFLLPHPDYPSIKDISMMKGRPPKPLVDCNGFCGTNDLRSKETEKELNYGNS